MPPSTVDASAGRPSAPAIRTLALTKRYGSARGIERLDLTVERGEVFGFLGPNGAGKSTTIRTMLDLIRPTSGRAELLGLDSRRDSIEIRRRVGYLPGDLSLYERLTGHELLDWLSRLRGGPALDPTYRNQLVERFALDLGRPVKELSKGNRQKLGVVQALMHRPELLVLDEPTAGLDPLMQDEFRQVVRETVAEGRTVFLSSHSLDEVQRVADRVGIIRDGEIVALDRVEHLLGQAVRKVELRFGEPVDPAPFARLSGVTELRMDDGGRVLRFSVSGNMDEVVKLAAGHRVVDLVSEAADLDEVFLALFRGGGVQRAQRANRAEQGWGRG